MQELKKRKNNSLKIDSFADSSKIFMRYLVILFLGLFNLFIIYFIFTPITVNSIYFILNLFYKSQLSQETIIIYPFDSETPFQIDLIPSCIAGAAYYFLIILNLSTPMNLRQRLLSLSFSVFFLFILNIFRIALLSFLFIYNSSLFDIVHSLFWHFLSTVFVILSWILSVYLFKITEIPIYSDIRNLLLFIRNKK